jgi:hypothetical protein
MNDPKRDEIVAALTEAATEAGLHLMNDDEAKEFFAGIPSLEEQEAMRLAEAEKQARIVLREGTDATTAILDELWTEAGKQTPESLPAFMAKLHSDYQHDYGTVCHAMAMAALGAAWAFDKGPQGGITGFQSVAVMWKFIRHWTGNKGAMKLVQYDDMLYPQYGHKFDKVLDPRTWQDLQKSAREKLENSHAAPQVEAHWQSIADGVVPFGYRIKGDDL